MSRKLKSSRKGNGINTRMPDDLFDAITRLAKKEGIAKATFVKRELRLLLIDRGEIR